MPTNPPDERDCQFCEIAEGDDAESRIVFRDRETVVFFPLEPATLGHLLVVPRHHIRDIWALDERLASRLAWATVEAAHAVKRAMNPEGLNVIQSNGEAATQTVLHLHVHVVPRWSDDNIGRIWPPETSYSERQKDSAWDAIRQEFQRITS